MFKKVAHWMHTPILVPRSVPTVLIAITAMNIGSIIATLAS